MGAWIIVLSDGVAAEWVLAESRMAFRDTLRAGRLNSGDPVALYVSRSAFHNPTRDRATIVATGRIDGDLSSRAVRVADKKYVASRRLTLEQVLPLRDGLPFLPLVGRLGFIRNKIEWGPYLRSALVEIPDRDFRTIERALSRAVAERQDSARH